MRHHPRSRRAVRLVAVLVAAGTLAGRAEAAGPLAPGTVLDQSNAAAAESLLSPENFAHYKSGEYRNTIAAWPAGPAWEASFAEASAKNAARLDVDERGTIVERDGGKPARGLYGLPFRIDPADGRAGVKAVWNAYYALWRFGSSHDVLALDWIGAKGLDRQAVLDSHTLYYEGAPPKHVPKENPNDLASQQHALVTSPAELNGTAVVGWRFRESDKRDQSWTYIPALRRVRQISPSNRSDGFLGSDLSQDDGPLFDGKPEDFAWKLVGEREQLALIDPRSLDGTAQRRARPDGGIEEEWPADQKTVGYQDPGWTGRPWAPLGPVLVQRKVWLVEAKPNDPYYQFDRIELAIDQETFQGVASRKFDKNGALLRSLQFLSAAPQPIELEGERLILPASSMAYILAENTKQGRATVIGVSPPGKSVHERRIPVDPALFGIDRLTSGK